MTVSAAVLAAADGPHIRGSSRPVSSVHTRAAPVCALHEADAATRPLYQRFVAARFAEVYGAQLYSFMPRLFGLEADGRLIAAFGLRDAGSEPLFLQRYLDLPVEEAVAAQVRAPVDRRQLAEIGNLAGATPGALRQLIPVLTRFLFESGYHWVLFTGSARLCNGFGRLGLPLQTLAQALPQRLPESERAMWGTYYAQMPSVMLGNVRTGHAQLQALAQSPGGLEALAAMGAP